jgi:hypothetical protein
VGSTWELFGDGTLPVIPLGAALYLSPDSDLLANVTTTQPNSLPSNASSGIFLTPQTTMPVTGEIWGVILKYSCSEVNKLDEFTILNRRINSSNSGYVPSSVFTYNFSDPNSTANDFQYFYTLDDNSSISVLSQVFDGPGINVIGFAEIGLSTGFATLLEDAGSWGYIESFVQNGVQNENGTLPSYNGLEDVEVFEFALWQTFRNEPDSTYHDWAYVENPIPELTGEYSDPQNPTNDPAYNGSMAAIGVRCTSSTVTGTATVNGLAGTFTDFVRKDPVIGQYDNAAVPRFSLSPAFLFLQLNSSYNEMLWLDLGTLLPGEFPRFGNYSVNYTLISTDMVWMGPLYVAANEPLLLDSSTPGVLTQYTSLMQSADLANALIAAYQQYAIQLMFLGEKDGNEAWLNSQVTAAVPWTLLTSGGGVPPLFVVVTMLIWAVACAGLSLAYGFQRRWSDSFDDCYLYCYCRDLRLDPLDVIREP